MNNNNTDDDKTVIYTGSSSPVARLVCLDTMLDESLRSLDIKLGVQDETLGRSDNNTIPIKYNKMSRNHARISFENNSWVIEDLKSANGIYINEQRIDKAAMGQGDIVVIGQVPFRFEIESAPPGAEPVVEPALADYEGDSGTMYAQHVGVIESLASSTDDDAEQLEDLPPPPALASDNKPEPAPVRQVAKPARSGGAGKTILVLLVLAMLGGGGFWYWQNSTGSKQADQLYKTYNKDVTVFLEQLESSKSVIPESTLRMEMSELQGFAARVDVALEQSKAHTGLHNLNRKLTFLQFERELTLLLQANSFYDAENLINKTREKIADLPAKPDELTEDFSGLLSLSETAIRFKRFSSQHGDPTPESNSQPDQYDMNKMLETKADFIDLKKENYQSLSVVYTRLHQMLERVEQQDIRILNRWQEIRKRTQ